MTEQSTSRTWYKEWWGIILTILFFPLVVPYLVWTKTTWSKMIKISITAVCAIIFICSMIYSNQKNQKSFELVKKAENFIIENKIDEAVIALGESQGLNTDKSKNPAFELEEKIKSLQSADFLRKTLIDLSDSDFELLQKGELKTSFISHDGLNTLFIAKLQENADQRAVYITEFRAIAKKEMIEKQFNAWDGSHIKLTSYIKKRMNDPDSYKHDETKYWDMNDYLIVITTYRGKNAFGGVVKESLKAKVSLDGEILKTFEQ